MPYRLRVLKTLFRMHTPNVWRLFFRLLFMTQDSLEFIYTYGMNSEFKLITGNLYSTREGMGYLISSDAYVLKFRSVGHHTFYVNQREVFYEIGELDWDSTMLLIATQIVSGRAENIRDLFMDLRDLPLHPKTIETIGEVLSWESVQALFG